jgi:DNA-binding transcriptional MocR family regulator
MLPPTKKIADVYRVSASTAHRAIAVLTREEYLRAEPGRGIVVTWRDGSLAQQQSGRSRSAAAEQLGLPPPPLSTPDSSAARRAHLSLEVRRRGQVVSRLMTEADPTNAAELRRLLAGVVRRAGHREDEIDDYEMDLRDTGGCLLGTFVSTSTT